MKITFTGKINTKVWLLVLGMMIVLIACGQAKKNKQEMTYMNITAKEAKELMDTETGYVILDVRNQEEYDEGHIPGAVVIPDTEIENQAEKILTDKEQLILVYCRSGRRSKNAATALAGLGYTNVKEFGGILDWPYEVE